MIKFTASGPNMILIGLGLEPENIQRLQKGQPIKVSLSTLGFTGAVGSVNIMIFTGTLEEMKKAIGPMIKSDTVIHKE